MAEQGELVFGRNAVLSFFTQLQGKAQVRTQNYDAGTSSELSRRVNKLLIMQGMRHDPRIESILDLAKLHKVPVQTVSQRELDHKLGPDVSHQGVVAVLNASAVLQMQDFLALLSAHDVQGGGARNPERHCMVALLDGIEDPQNLGAIIRVAEASGVMALFIPRHRSAHVTGTVAKTSAGAAAILPVVQVANLVHTVQQLKEHDFWIVGLDGKADMDYTRIDLRRRICAVIGNEGKGISRLLAEHCDFLVSIPMLGRTESLNAAVAAGIMLYEVVRQNRKQVNNEQLRR